ncbi:NAD-dependent protein deacetylase [Pararobbsia alpina]|uniref:NAD-dependent protein deacetylase n=1 Tax=Pararobbsia alpina TaxID=621374 RepID=UPI0039A68028
MSERSAAEAANPSDHDVVSGTVVSDGTQALDALADFVERHPRLFILGGAGVSTESGIPDYRDENGERKGRDPIMLKDFLKSDLSRRRYWARNMIGWPTVQHARPNAAHRALSELQKLDRVERLVTQNVDGLHTAAGSTGVIELHGNVADVVCIECGYRHARADIQIRLERENPDWLTMNALPLPDGDARLESDRFDLFHAPDCERCGGVIKPDVVFFGEGVPRMRVDAALASLARADAMLVVGSSLMVYSGFRFCDQAARAGTPIAAVNIGRTRADGLLSLKVPVSCGEILPALVERLTQSAAKAACF